MVYKYDCVNEDEWRGQEWYDATESDLRKEIQVTIEKLDLDISLDDEVYTAYKKMLEDCYELPHCRFELIEKN